jgi:hypothetical protein
VYAHEFVFHPVIAIQSPLKTAVAGVCILALAFRKTYNALVVSVVLLLISGNALHPWYILPLLFFNLRANYKSLWFWSFAIVISYMHYRTYPYASPYWLTYIIHWPALLYFVWEYFYQPKNYPQELKII